MSHQTAERQNSDPEITLKPAWIKDAKAFRSEDKNDFLSEHPSSNHHIFRMVTTAKAFRRIKQ